MLNAFNKQEVILFVGIFRFFAMAIFNDRFAECYEKALDRHKEDGGVERGFMSKVASEMGVSRGLVKAWLDNRSQNPKNENLIKIAKHFNVSPSWLLGKSGAFELRQPDEAGYEVYSNKVPEPHIVAVRGTAALGNDGYYLELSESPAGDGYIEAATNDPDAYVIRFRGQSMFPAIRDGWFGLIEPNSDLQVGEYVLVALKDGRKMVKELLNQRNGTIELLSVNGDERFSFDWVEIKFAHFVAAIIGPSKYKTYLS